MFPRNQTAVIRNIKNKLFCKRAGIEPTIDHLKSDYRLGRNFYKGVTDDTMNVLLASAVYNFKMSHESYLVHASKKYARYCSGTISRKNVF